MKGPIMQTVTMDANEAHQFATYEDAEIVASQWRGAEVQEVTFRGLNPEPRTVWFVVLPVPARDYRVGYISLKGF
jgi:hypothetical protein